MENIYITNYWRNSGLHKSKVFYDIKIALIICLLPFLIFSHLFFSEGSDVFHFLNIGYHHKYADNQVFAWSFLISIIPLLLTLIIYYNTNKGWRYFLIPTLITLFLSSIIVFTNTWEEHYYVLKLEGQIWVLFFLENLFFYDNMIFKKYRMWKLRIYRKELWDEMIYGNYDKLNRKIKEILLSKDLTSLQHYICRIYYMLQILNRKAPGFFFEIPMERSEDRFRKPDLVKGAFVIGITLLLFAHTIVPKNMLTIEFQSFEIGSFGFNSVHTFIWYSSHRLSLLILFLWCFFQSEHWWRWSLLSPIIFYTYQLWELFIRVRIDEIQNIIYLSPILLLIVLIHLISKSIRKQLQTYQYKAMIENELEARIKEAGKLRND